jgi:hypothetical protein
LEEADCVSEHEAEMNSKQDADGKVQQEVKQEADDKIKQEADDKIKPEADDKIKQEADDKIKQEIKPEIKDEVKQEVEDEAEGSVKLLDTHSKAKAIHKIKEEVLESHAIEDKFFAVKRKAEEEVEQKGGKMPKSDSSTSVKEEGVLGVLAGFAL